MSSSISAADAIGFTPLGACLARRRDAGAVFGLMYASTAAGAANNTDHAV